MFDIKIFALCIQCLQTQSESEKGQGGGAYRGSRREGQSDETNIVKLHGCLSLGSFMCANVLQLARHAKT